MKKSVLISIQPKWVEKIVKGEKTIEVRKTRPKIETPFKCYIYCTNGEILYDMQRCGIEDIESRIKNGFQKRYTIDDRVKSNKYLCGSIPFVNRKLIGEFICNHISDTWYDDISKSYYFTGDFIRKATCLTSKEIDEYGKGKPLYAWHISNLIIYDKPKELSEFCAIKKCNSCKQSGYEHSACIYDEKCEVPTPIKKAPQSWCYCESFGGVV